MRFYIASRLENADTVRTLAARLIAAGHVHTYDWTHHGSVQERPELWAPVALAETEGVTSADVVIGATPGRARHSCRTRDRARGASSCVARRAGSELSPDLRFLSPPACKVVCRLSDRTVSRNGSGAHS